MSLGITGVIRRAAHSGKERARKSGCVVSGRHSEILSITRVGLLGYDRRARGIWAGLHRQARCKTAFRLRPTYFRLRRDGDKVHHAAFRRRTGGLYLARHACVREDDRYLSTWSLRCNPLQIYQLLWFVAHH